MAEQKRKEDRGTVLLPLDGTPQSASALPVARKMAALMRSTLHILHVTDQPLPFGDLSRKLGLQPAQLGGAVLEEAVGDPAESIVRLAAERRSALIVMAMHAAGRESPSGLGSVAEAVLRRRPCPLLLTQQDHGLEGWEPREILLPQDGTPGAASAVGPAVDLARISNATLLALHVTGPEAPAPRDPGTLRAPQYIDQPQYEWPSWSEEFIERIEALCCYPGEVNLQLLLTKGEPGSEIVRLAQERGADIIVLVWHGSLAPERAHTMKTVIRHAPCPVFILPFDPSVGVERRRIQLTSVERARPRQG